MSFMKKSRLLLVAGAATASFASSGHGAELSLVNGLFSNQSFKTNGSDAGSRTTIQAGGRYSEQLDGPLFWFGQGDLTLRNYSKGNNAEAPSNATSLSLGGGVRYYFNKLTEHVQPFSYVLGQFVSSKEATPSAGKYEEKDKNGLYYGGAFGIRLSLQKEFFVDLEVPLFTSALFATEKTEEVTFGPPRTSNKSESTKTELFAQSTGNLTDLRVALGMRF